jgi:putative FmdB family regulatory protein
MKYKCKKCGAIFEVLSACAEPQCPNCGETEEITPLVVMNQ